MESKKELTFVATVPSERTISFDCHLKLPSFGSAIRQMNQYTVNERESDSTRRSFVEGDEDERELTEPADENCDTHYRI